jgi:hypothetical protein
MPGRTHNSDNHKIVFSLKTSETSDPHSCIKPEKCRDNADRVESPRLNGSLSKGLDNCSRHLCHGRCMRRANNSSEQWKQVPNKRNEEQDQTTNPQSPDHRPICIDMHNLQRGNLSHAKLESSAGCLRPWVSC